MNKLTRPNFFVVVCGIAIMIACLSFALGSDKQQQADLPLYKDPKQPVEDRVNDLLKRMTLEEKVFQMCALYAGTGEEIFQSDGTFSLDFYTKNMSNGVGFISSPSVSQEAKRGAEIANAIQKIAVEKTRLGIPVIMIDEGLHGLTARGATSYPQALGLAATWDEAIVKNMATNIGAEAVSRGTRQLLSPVLDIGRDPRTGRVEETYGEDPYLVSNMAVAYVKGAQSNKIIATGKHFVANFVADGGRDSGPIEFSERQLREVYFKPYERAVKEAGLMGIMAAYSSIDAVPCSSNHWLLTDVLRKEWGFNGIVVSDWSGLVKLHSNHHVSASPNESAVLGVKAGLDVDLPRLKIYQLLVEEVKKGHVDVSFINQSVARILTLKFKIGLFEKPYVDVNEAAKLQDAPAFRELALKAARESMVLLKNEKQFLPFSTSIKNIAVIGPNANVLQLGGYSGAGIKGLTPFEGIKAEFPGAKVSLAKGCAINDSSDKDMDEAVKLAKLSDAVVLVMGGSTATQGETHDRIDLRLMGQQQKLINEVVNVNKNVVVVLVNGGPVIVKDWVDKVPALVMAWYGGEEGGRVIGEILAGKCNPSGKLPITFPYDNGQIPIYYNSRPYGREGRTVEMPGKDADFRYYPQYPFGFGLSYTTYSYNNIKCVPETPDKGKPVNVTLTIKNEGNRDGDEIVQLYIGQKVSRIVLPEKRLIAYRRVNIKAGESVEVSFKVNAEDMQFLDEKLKPEIQTGEYIITAGKNSVEGIIAKFQLR